MLSEVDESSLPQEVDVDLVDQETESSSESIRPTWVEDDAVTDCATCDVEFSLFKRRHHCRGCGRIFCSDCSNRWLKMPPEYGYDDPQRLCEQCYKDLSVLDFTKKYDEFGDPSKPTIVMLHGAVANRALFGMQTAELSANFHILVPDLPGHGTREGEKLTMETALKVVRDLITDHAPRKSAVLFGYSMGGYIAMAFAATYPDLCDGLVVGGAGSNMQDANVMLAFVGLVYKILPEKTKANLLRGTAELIMSAELDDDVLDKCLTRSGSNYEAWPEIKDLLTSDNEDYAAHLAKYFGAVLFINGEQDSREAEETWLEAAHNSRLEVIPQAGHMMILDQRFYPQVNSTIAQFVRDVYSEETKASRHRSMSYGKSSLAKKLQEEADAAKEEEASGVTEPQTSDDIELVEEDITLYD